MIAMSGDRARRLGAVLGVVGVLMSACGKGSIYSSGGGTGNANATGVGSGLSTQDISGIGTVLDTSTGFTLYHLTTEATGTISCTGACAATWPPFLTSSGAPPSRPSGLSGTLGTITRPDGGVQVTFDGMALYTYSGDSAPGQANGQGIGGVWFAVTPSGSAPPPAGGRYGTPPSGY